MTFDVAEVQDMTTYRRWLWRGVEAASADEAAELVLSGAAAVQQGIDPEDHGTIGDTSLGRSGVAAVAANDAIDDAWQCACQGEAFVDSNVLACMAEER